MKVITTLLLFLACCTPSFAQHAHGQKGPNGGQMEDVAGLHLELLTSGNTLTINVFDEGNKPVATRGYSASAMIISNTGSNRETLNLAPFGSNSLTGEAKNNIGTGLMINIMLKTDAGKSAVARFKK